ncbi:hypothetical protein KHX94_00020 [Shewanella dokdonensis]|uniref:Uncharacterized protein n=1 Tax=Shewanella dokdonensis TaxID=712036 RepID=A0ABX8DGD1_9GAMM|nr:hypothetical protein [Shewanella dokdonensis]QVK23271.1 hypothetical protein KHX94_00020 [Shewanella dokdonensis]
MDKSGAGRIGFRQQAYDASTWGQFNEIYHTGHKPSYAEVGAAPATHSHSWSQVANIPVTASRWPAWNEVSSKPATFPPAAHTHDYVPTARKVNGKALTADISLTAADVGPQPPRTATAGVRCPVFPPPPVAGRPGMKSAVNRQVSHPRPIATPAR